MDRRIAAALAGTVLAVVLVSIVPSALPPTASVEDAPSARARTAALARIDLSRIYHGLPRDAIPPLNSPAVEPGSDATWLGPDELIVGIVSAGQARAYPFIILNFHEIVNDRFAGREILVAYCPLCRSALLFDRQLGGQTLTFGNTGALYEADLLLYDHQTNSTWWQVLGLAIEGPLRGQSLRLLPATVSTWRDWLRAHPGTEVLSLKTGYNRPYVDRDPFYAYFRDPGSEPPYPVSSTDRRLPPKLLVLGLEVRGRAYAYPVPRWGTAVLNELLDGVPVAIFVNNATQLVAAYDPQVRGERLIFVREEDRITDRNTGSTWDWTGRAIAGPLQGTQLLLLPSRAVFWYVWVAAYPETQVIEPSG